MATAHSMVRLPGSTTATFLQLDPATATLTAANLGDSGFMLVRQGVKVQRSRQLQHFFDCPLQFGACPEYVEGTDTANDADLFTIDVLPGDVIIVGSDGLWCVWAD